MEGWREVEIRWVSVSRKLVSVTKPLRVVALLSRAAAELDVVTADRGKCTETCAYLSIMPAASGMQRPADHSKEKRM